MGNETSYWQTPRITFTPNQDSIVDGRKVVKSGPIPFDPVTFLEETLEVFEYPVHPSLEHLVKFVDFHQVTDFSDDPIQWEVKVVLDGKKVDSCAHLRNGKGDGIDLLHRWCKSGYNPRTGLLTSFSYLPGYMGEADVDPQLQLKSFARFLKNPFHVEYWWEDYREGRNGERDAGEEPMRNLQMLLTNPTHALQKRKARLILNAAGDAAVSEPLDEFLTYEELLDGWFSIVRKSAEDEDGCTVTETIPGEQFFASLRLASPADRLEYGMGESEPGCRAGALKVDMDPQEGTLIFDYMYNGDITRTDTVKATLAPLRVTCTKEDRGCTSIRKPWLLSMQLQLDAVLYKESSGWLF